MEWLIGTKDSYLEHKCSRLAWEIPGKHKKHGKMKENVEKNREMQ